MSEFGISMPIADLPGIGDRIRTSATGHRVGNVLRQGRHAFDLDRRSQLDLVPRDGGTAGVAGDLGVDLELIQDFGQRLDYLVRGGRAGPVRAALTQGVAGGKRVGDVARERQLLDPLRQRRVRRRFAGPVAFAVARGDDDPRRPVATVLRCVVVARPELPCQRTLAKQWAVVGQAVVRDVGAPAAAAQQ